MAKKPNSRRNSPDFTSSVPPANPSQTGVQNVEYIRPELVAIMPQYDEVEDCVGGQPVVKAKGDIYLPRPNATDLSPGNKARYEAYRTRAVFYNVTRRTLGALVGQVMMKPPVVKVPTLLDPVVKDATGTGVSLEQLSYQAEALVISLGRAGVFVDYPPTDGPTTRKQQEDGDVRPTITVYPPKDVINWRVRTKGSKTLLNLVVLREVYTKEDDGFETKTDIQYRVLRLSDDNVVTVEIWRKEGTWASIVDKGYTPADSAGNVLTEIPFIFIGALDNDPSIDAPPLYDMASLNIAHYRNSADYEESVFMVGQPTPWISGLTEDWVKEVLGGVVMLGSRAVIPLPVEGAAGLLEMQPNPAPLEAMKHKEEQMKALGAKLVEPKSGQKTATEATMDTAADSSALHVATKNVSAAFLWALEWAGIFVGVTSVKSDAADKDTKTIDFELNTDFDFGSMSSEQVTATLAAYEKGTITFKEMRDSLRRIGLATLPDEEAQKAIREEQAEAGKMQNEIDAGNPKFADKVDPVDKVPEEL